MCHPHSSENGCCIAKGKEVDIEEKGPQDGAFRSL